MDDYLVGVLSNIGVISFVALSAYLLLLTGEISFGQQAFFAIGAYAAGIATALWGWPLAAALVWGAAIGGGAAVLVGLPTLAAARPLFRDRDARLRGDGAASCSSCSAIRCRSTASWSGPNGADGFRNIRYIFENNIDAAAIPAADLCAAGGGACSASCCWSARGSA